jgi:hypothetical protein
VAALDEVDQLVDDELRLAEPLLVPLERQPVAAEEDRASEPLAKRAENATVDRRKLGCDFVRDVENLLQRPKCSEARRRSNTSPR